MLCASFLMLLPATRLSSSIGAGGSGRWLAQGLPRYRAQLHRRASLPCCAGGFGAKLAKPPSVDGKAQLKRSEKDYKTIEKLAWGKDGESPFILREYIVSARLKPDVPYDGMGRLSDWVPIAFIGLLSEDEVEIEQREIEFAVASLAPSLLTVLRLTIDTGKKLSPEHVQYGFETADGFHEHVYDNVMQLYDESENSEDKMSSREARDVLGIDDTASYSELRAVYRKLIAELHPDRNEGPDAADKFRRVKAAYKIVSALPAMTGLSWFESWGGSDRNFVGPILNRQLVHKRPDDIKAHVLSGNSFAALWQYDPDVMKKFGNGNLQRAMAKI